jgi:5'/3'-nucleotidase
MVRKYLAVGVCAVALLAACSSSNKSSSSATPSTTIAPTSTTTAEKLRVLVTNDDGVTAPGIDALVEALRKLDNTSVTVIAPATNQSGSGSKTTGGTLTAFDAKTASGYPAKAVKGFPADSVIYALDQGGLTERPHVVISGTNNGQNLGTVVDASGTIGAARAAAQRGIPALAVSQGLANATHPADYPASVAAAVAWLGKHRAELAARDTASTAPSTVTNMNVATCPSGEPRTAVVVGSVDTTANGIGPTVDCVTAFPSPKSDVEAFLHGYVAETDNLPIKPASG